MKKITDNKPRNPLNEGRNFGIGFSFLKKLTPNKFETVMPFTACKDYLNDFIYVETTKNTLGSIHGFKHNRIDIFDKKRKFTLGVNTLHRKGGGNWENFDACKKILIDNYKNLERFLNEFEEFIGLKFKSKIIIDEDVIIIDAPLYWSKNTGLISVFTLLIRCYFNVSEEELNKGIKDILTNHKPYISDDNYMKSSCLQFYNKLENNKKAFDNFNYEQHNIKNEPHVVHNFGIQAMLPKIK